MTKELWSLARKSMPPGNLVRGRVPGHLAVTATLLASRGLWGFAADRFGWSLLPVGCQVRQPRG